MAKPPPGREKPGSKVSKLDRDTSKTNVALNKVKQRDAMAVKAFSQRQKQVKDDLANIKKLKKVIDAAIAKVTKDRQLDQRFIRLIGKFCKTNAELTKQLKADQKSFAEIVDKPQTYQTMISQVSKISEPKVDMTYGNASVMLAILIVFLKRWLQLKLKK